MPLRGSGVRCRGWICFSGLGRVLRAGRARRTGRRKQRARHSFLGRHCPSRPAGPRGARDGPCRLDQPVDVTSSRNTDRTREPICHIGNTYAAFSIALTLTPPSIARYRARARGRGGCPAVAPLQRHPLVRIDFPCRIVVYSWKPQYTTRGSQAAVAPPPNRPPRPSCTARCLPGTR